MSVNHEVRRTSGPEFYMNRRATAKLMVAVFLLAIASLAAFGNASMQAQEQIDVNRARQIVLKQRTGQPLTDVWGPYLWADGLKPRKLDGLVWERKDLSPHDGTHPSGPGREKVAQLILEFFKSNPTSGPWFVKAAK
jgi:hypothetical protein